MSVQYTEGRGGGGGLQYTEGYSVHWGISLSTPGCSVDWEDIMSTPGSVQYSGGYHDKCGGYHEYSGGCSVHWGIHDECEGYHE